MKFLRICASAIVLASSASTSIRAQIPAVGIQTAGPVHVVSFQTPQGVIRLHVSSDASAGDTISGTIAAEAAGATAQAREANLGRLNALLLEWQGARTPVSARRYEWPIPTTLRTGLGPLVLRDGEGRLVSQTSFPVDPVPAPAPSGPSSPDAFELPSEGEASKIAVIRGPSDGRLAGKTVTVGAIEAELLAASPRQLAFRLPTNVAGPVALRFSSDGQLIGQTRLRIFLVQGEAPPGLGEGQKGTLKVTVSGLTGITEPVRLSLVNQTPAIVRVENIDRPITIEPRQVTPQGTFIATRQMTGVRRSTGQILVSVGSPPLAQFDVRRAMTRTLTDWQAKTRVGITTDANAQIQRSVIAARTPLDDFLRGQQANQGDVQTIFAALLSHYCFDLRDDRRPPQRGAVSPGGPRLRLVALGQNQGGATEITAGEVGRLSFSDFLNRLISRFSEQKPVGFLFVSSTPGQAPITLDGRRNSEVTNRRFVLLAGDHTVVVDGRRTCREKVTVTAFQTKVIDCGA